MRVVFAEDLFPLNDGLTRPLNPHGIQITAAAGNGAGLLASVTRGQARYSDGRSAE